MRCISQTQTGNDVELDNLSTVSESSSKYVLFRFRSYRSGFYVKNIFSWHYHRPKIALRHNVCAVTEKPNIPV